MTRYQQDILLQLTKQHQQKQQQQQKEQSQEQLAKDGIEAEVSRVLKPNASETSTNSNVEMVSQAKTSECIEEKYPAENVVKLLSGKETEVRVNYPAMSIRHGNVCVPALMQGSQQVLTNETGLDPNQFVFATKELFELQKNAELSGSKYEKEKEQRVADEREITTAANPFEKHINKEGGEERAEHTHCNETSHAINVLLMNKGTVEAAKDMLTVTVKESQLSSAKTNEAEEGSLESVAKNPVEKFQTGIHISTLRRRKQCKSPGGASAESPIVKTPKKKVKTNCSPTASNFKNALACGRPDASRCGENTNNARSLIVCKKKEKKKRPSKSSKGEKKSSSFTMVKGTFGKDELAACAASSLTPEKGAGENVGPYDQTKESVARDEKMVGTTTVIKKKYSTTPVSKKLNSRRRASGEAVEYALESEDQTLAHPIPLTHDNPKTELENLDKKTEILMVTKKMTLNDLIDSIEDENLRSAIVEDRENLEQERKERLHFYDEQIEEMKNRLRVYTTLESLAEQIADIRSSSEKKSSRTNHSKTHIEDIALDMIHLAWKNYYSLENTADCFIGIGGNK